MSAINQEGNGNNDHLFNVRDAKSVCVVENTLTGRVNEEIFKKVVGGDQMQVQKKYGGGISIVYRTKLCFMLNDPPVWSSSMAFGTHRRIWHLPMLAQRLAQDDDQRKKLESEGKSHYIFDLDINFLEDIINNHISAYITWCVQGAVMYFQNNQKIVSPKTVNKATNAVIVDRIELFISFIKEYLIMGDSKSRISSAEILEAFLINEEMDTDIDHKAEDELYRILKATLMDPKNRIRAFERCKYTRAMLPSRNKDNDGFRKSKCYQFIAWAPGPIAEVVNGIRSQYTKETRPMISSVPLLAEGEEEDNMDPS